MVSVGVEIADGVDVASVVETEEGGAPGQSSSYLGPMSPWLEQGQEAEAGDTTCVGVSWNWPQRSLES